MAKVNGAPKLPPAPERASALTSLESWYLAALTSLRKFHGRPVSLAELAAHCRRSRSAVYQALQRMERKGRVARDLSGHYSKVAA